MSKSNKSYRIRTDVGSANNGFVSIDTNLIQDYEVLDILSIKINSVDTYRLHNSEYGVVVGRVLANNGFGIPNAKLSIFIGVDSEEGELIRNLYPFTTSHSKDGNDVRYNLLPDEKVDDCHQIVGTFPNKRYMLDNDLILEIYDKYYKYTTRTNNSGDYMIMGVPVGTHTLHMDLDLSDCGILSQRPRDFAYKGYTIEQFENPSMFKEGTNYTELSQVFTQDQVISVRPFWGNESLGEPIGLTRVDLDVAFKFETTCVFLGCVTSDNNSNGITKKCMATENMGNMEELTTGEGRIEMIRKTPGGDVESFQIKGTQLINSDGVWCYQIPMNLDYMMTDEFGNMVPTDDPEKGIATRTSVRFRISMEDNEENVDNFFRGKVLVPHNPHINEKTGLHEDYDYEFGTFTKENSFRDLFWDNVYAVKSYIPRIQKKKNQGWKDKKFTGIKNCNFYGTNNPIPYNNIRIKLPLMFTVMCAIINSFIKLVGYYNGLITVLATFLQSIGNWGFKKAIKTAQNLKLTTLQEGLCPDLENWYFAPLKGIVKTHKGDDYDLLSQTLNSVIDDNDSQSIESDNGNPEDDIMCITTKTDYLIACIEMNLAMEYRVINFDFYNDWINGMIYIPRFMRYVKHKRVVGGNVMVKSIVKGCMDNIAQKSWTRRYTQQCSLGYKGEIVNNKFLYTDVENPLAKKTDNFTIKKSNRFHKKQGFNQTTILGKSGGLCHEHTTLKNQNVYYMKPCEWKGETKVTLYATDIVLLGSLKTCNENGLPQAFKYLSSTSYVMPPNLALTNMESNGPVYVNDKNTYCGGSSSMHMTSLEDSDNTGVSVLPASAMSISNELKALDNGDPNNDVQYEGNELSDNMALTEIAGISWNYTGPGQGEINKRLMYYPGGHFLGLSCVNSQTNIKSCVNLSRICEVGSSMSQFKEDILSTDSEGNIKYVYTAPTGFISGNDIVGEDFRSMFATMNSKILKAKRYNPETGYYVYDFDFLKLINFDGTFQNISDRAYNLYNHQSDLTPVEDTNKLNKYGISTDGLSDGVITQTRTIEDVSIDYYCFRYGLTPENLSKKDLLHRSKFLKVENGYAYLPQYENSFYFYFGMKAGASAIDEFNKQFFSVCDTSKIINGTPNIQVNLSNINYCELKGDATFVVDNMEMPLRDVRYTVEKDGKIEEHRIENDNNIYGNYVITTSGLGFGNYTITVMDSNGDSVSSKFKIGIDKFNYTKNITDFNVADVENILNISPNINRTFFGGTVEIPYIIVDSSVINDIASSVTVILKYIDGENNVLTAVSGTIPTSLEYTEENKITLNVNSGYTDYHLYLGVKCNESGNTAEMYMETFQVKDGSKIELNMGFSDLPLNLTVGTSGNGYTTILSGDTYVKSDISGVTNFTYGTRVMGKNEYWSVDYEKWWESITVTSVSGETIDKWLGRNCTIKRTPEDVTFSNNVYVKNGTKVLWGVPQNADEVLINGIIKCSDKDEIPDGYSLDDDASYKATMSSGKHYSAIGVDGSVVAGNYFAILSGGTVYSGTSNSCYGKVPAPNGGYVLKTLPDGDLYYYYIKNNNFNFEMPSGYSGNGVYYSSFMYPVKEEPFTVESNFFIWSQPSVNGEYTNNIFEYEELGGRTELTIKNGLRYNTHLGGPNGENLSVSNIAKYNTWVQSSITVSGSSVLITETNDNGMQNSYYKDINENGVAKGVANLEEVSYQISEGYPYIGSGTDLSYVVNELSDSFYYKDFFSPNVEYKFKKGLGVVVYEMTGYNNDADGFICCFKTDSAVTNNFIYWPEDTNDGYIYKKSGKNWPVYDILCQYQSGGSDYFFLKIDYTDNNNARVTFTQPDGSMYWTYYGDEKVTINGSEWKANRVRRHLKQYKNSLPDLIYFALNAYENGEEALNGKIEPVKKYNINSNKADWVSIIESGRTAYMDLVEKSGGTINNLISTISGNTYFYVKKYTNTVSNGTGILNLYKIYPNFNEIKYKMGDGIELDYYYFDTAYSKPRSGITSGNTYYIYFSGDTENEENYKDSKNYEANGIKYLTSESNDSQTILTGTSGSVYTLYSGDVFDVKITKEEIGEHDGDGIKKVYFNIDISIKSGATNIGSTEKKQLDITFYTSTPANGETLSIVRHAAVISTPYLYKTSKLKEELSILTSNNKKLYDIFSTIDLKGEEDDIFKNSLKNGDCYILTYPKEGGFTTFYGTTLRTNNLTYKFLASNFTHEIDNDKDKILTIYSPSNTEEKRIYRMEVDLIDESYKERGGYIIYKLIPTPEEKVEYYRNKYLLIYKESEETTNLFEFNEKKISLPFIQKDDE